MIGKRCFELIAIVVVMLVGGGFGALAGVNYFPPMGIIWGVVLGAIGGYGVAKWYLSNLPKIIKKAETKLQGCVAGGLFGGFSGVLCTVFLHAMLAILSFTSMNPQGSSIEKNALIYPMVWSVALCIGAVAGFVTGLILTLAYSKGCAENINATQQKEQDN